MTVAVVVKVFDGIVLAADSATTMPLRGGAAQVYNNANKIFHLHRRRPVGAMTWGLGNIGAASISTLTKDLRRRLMGRDPQYLDWELGNGYTIEQVADRLVQMFYDELYLTEHGGTSDPPALGMLVAGYSAGAKQAEAWLVAIDNTRERPTPRLAVPFDAAGWIAYAQPEAAHRLFQGVDPATRDAMSQALRPSEWAKVATILTQSERQPVMPAMPFADAIALANFLVDVTVGYSHYLLGPDTVGGSVEVAGINRHEGFKWISRKHYYSDSLNPEEPRHDH